jgi:hypothetical protein
MTVADTASVPWDIDAVGTCGGLQPCNDAKVVDVPEMGVSLLDTWSRSKLTGSTRATTSPTPEESE